MSKVPLKFYFLAHQRSDSARRLALALADRFQEPPATGGLRVPVFFTPDRGDDLPPAWNTEGGPDLDSAQHTIVVVLSDARMARKVKDGTGNEWKAFLDEGVKLTPYGTSDHQVFGVAVGDRGFALSDDRHMLRVADAPARQDGEADEEYASRIDAWSAAVVDGLALEITVQAVQLLKPEARPDEGKAPVTLFLSHAKKDLDPDQADPVRLVEEDIKELPIKHWMDSAEIPPGDKFETQISAGVRDCAIVVVFLTDSYASRPWCQREVLHAKSLGVPILVVDALENGEPRSFPYLGNLPTLHWPVRADEAAQRQVAHMVVGRAMRETLRLVLNRARLQTFAEADEIVLSSAPEAISLAWNHDNPEQAQRFLYPDPPLAKQELLLLNSLRRNATFVTPLTKLAAAGFGSEISAVAVSISESGDLARHGISEKQEGTLVDEIHLYLLVAGLQIAYGGGLSGNFDKASNFTLRLFNLVENYSELALQAGSEGLRPIINYPPWPLSTGYTDREYDLFGSIAELVEGARPSEQEVPEPDDELFPPVEKGWRLLPTNPPQRLAWTRGLTLMRKQVTGGVQARIVIGGKMANYFGLYPGVAEEAWISVLAKQPLYLVGAFGGASAAVIDALSGDGSALLESCAAVAQLDEVLELAKARGAELIGADQPTSFEDVGTPHKLILGERLVADLVAAGAPGPAATLNNGLSDAENVQLFRSTDPATIAELILRGLRALGG